MMVLVSIFQRVGVLFPSGAHESAPPYSAGYSAGAPVARFVLRPAVAMNVSKSISRC
jgi:hypothetical protein